MSWTFFSPSASVILTGGAVTLSWFALNERRPRWLEQARTDPRLRALLGDPLDQD